MSHVCIHANAIFEFAMRNSYLVIELYTYSVGLRRCSFRLIGQFLRASECGASIKLGFTFFFMSQWDFNTNNIKQNAYVNILNFHRSEIAMLFAVHHSSLLFF